VATVRELLEAGIVRLRQSGSETARLDAELLLGHAIGTDRTTVIAHTDAPVGDGSAPGSVLLQIGQRSMKRL